MPETNFPHPETAPTWLNRWPAATDLARMFAPGVRQVGLRTMHGDEELSLNWDDRQLIFRYGPQRAIWQLQPDGFWKHQCSCGLPGGKCAHNYAAAVIFNELRQRLGWRRPGEAGPALSPVSRPAPSAAPAPIATLQPALPGLSGAMRAAPAPERPPMLPMRPVPAPAQPAGHLASPQRTSWRQPEIARAPAGQPPPAQLFRLIAEADHLHHPPWVTLRFYKVDEHGMRQIMRLQATYSEAVYQKRVAPHASRWDETSRHLFGWLAWYFNDERHRNLVTHLEVCKLSKNEFAQWQEFWEQYPDRLLDRADQTPIFRKIRQATLRFDLDAADDNKIRIDPVLDLDGDGTVLLHQVFANFGPGLKTLTLNGETYDFTPPIAPKLLADVFSSKSPLVAADKVAEHLGPLLEGRLDLVGGPIVRHTDTVVTPLLEVGVQDGDFVFHLSAEDKALGLGEERVVLPSAILRHDYGFEVRRQTCAGTEALSKFFAVVAPDRRGRLPGTQANLEKLREAWAALPADLPKKAGPEIAGVLGSTVATAVPELAVLERGNFYDITLNWRLGDAMVTDRELRGVAMSGRNVFRTTAGDWLRFDPGEYRELRRQFAESGITTEGSARLFGPEASDLLKRSRPAEGAGIAAPSRDLADRLCRQPPVAVPPLPAEFESVLRDYQKKGYEFLADRFAASAGAILADDMGLGKTVQALALISAIRDQAKTKTGAAGGKGVLIVCPASVVAVWLGEAAKFCPGLRCRAYLGQPEARSRILLTSNWDCLVTTYGMVRSDAELLAERTFALIILDEAQAIKNPDAKIATSVKLLRAPARLALTGTPLENRMLDLWSIMDFLNPGFLGERDDFLRRFAAPETGPDLRLRVMPLMLRRTKDKVAKELPPRTEETILIEMPEAQRAFYNGVLREARQRLVQKGPIDILAALTRLRQACCHPAILDAPAVPSEKLATLLAMVSELIDEGHSVLVFSQFVTMLDLIDNALGGIRRFKITGETPLPERQRRIDDFSAGDAAPAVFLLSLKAAGTGLTLTKADYVFIMDPWWNPAVERQAIDRTHRIGQDKPVIAYRLVMKDTIEQKVVALQQEKAALFDAVIEGAANLEQSRLTAADLQALLG
jgi:superfamily II DNA or RNA helicase